MKLYSFDLSPFSSRVRLAMRAKGLRGIEILAPPGGPKSPEYLSLNPIGKVPALVLEDGSAIVESQVIVEYLEDTHPEPRLLPSTPEARARMRTVVRVVDLYLMPALGRLFGQMDPRSRDAAVVEKALQDLAKAHSDLEFFLTGDRHAVAAIMTQADCALIPYLFLADRLLPAFGKADLVSGHPKTAAYWASVQKEALVAELLAEMDAGLAKMMAQRTGA